MSLREIEVNRIPSVNIREKPLSEGELQWLRNEGMNFDEEVERARIRLDKKSPADAGSLRTRKIATILRGKHRAQWLKIPLQDHFETHTRFREALKCDRGFSFAQNGFVNQVRGDAKEFMDMYEYRYEVDDECKMAAIRVKDIMREQGLEVSGNEKWEDEDESGCEDTDEDMFECECEHNKCECIDGID
jgi:hypothetical protein